MVAKLQLPQIMAYILLRKIYEIAAGHGSKIHFGKATIVRRTKQKVKF